VIDESERLKPLHRQSARYDQAGIRRHRAEYRAARYRQIIGSVLRRAGKILAHHNVSLSFAADMPMLDLDAVLFEQVLLIY